MGNIKAIIIDDEEDSREALFLAVDKFCPQVKLLARCDGPDSGLAAIAEHKPDLVFLDVQMPRMSGFDMLEKLATVDFHVIFVTAYDKYAVKAIRFSAFDYLLKPVDIDDLVNSIGRLEEKINDTQSPLKTSEAEISTILNNHKNADGKTGKIAIPTDEGLEFLDIDGLMYCKADGSYTEIHCANKKRLLASKTLKDFEHFLDSQLFCRVHHSYLVHVKFIEKYIKTDGGYLMMKNGIDVPVSRRKKDRLFELIDKI